MIRILNLDAELARVRLELERHGACQLENGAAVLGVNHADNFTAVVSLVFWYRDFTGTWRMLLFRYVWLGEEYVSRITSETEDGVTQVGDYHILDLASRVSGLYGGNGITEPLWDEIDGLADDLEAHEPADFKAMVHVLRQLLIREFVRKLRAAAHEGEAFTARLKHRRRSRGRKRAKELGGVQDGESA